MQEQSQTPISSFSVSDYRKKYDSVKEYIYCLSGEGIILYLNKACSEFLQKPIEEVIGQNAKDYIPSKIYQIGNDYNEYVKHQGFHITEVCYEHRWFRFIKAQVNLEHNESAITTIVKDITEKKVRQLQQLKNMYSVNAGLIDSQNLLAQINLDISQLVTPYSVILCDLARQKENNLTFGTKVTNTHLEQIKKLMYACLAGREYWIHQVGGCFILIINNASEGEIFFLRDNIKQAFKDNQQFSEQLHANFGIAHIKNNDETFANAIDIANRQLYLNKYQNKINLALNDHILDFEIERTKQKNNEHTQSLTLSHLPHKEKRIFLEKSFHASSNIFALVKTTDITLLAVNDTFCELSGYAEEEVIGQPASFCFPSFADKQIYLGHYSEIKEKGYWEGECYFQDKHKKIYFCLIRMEAIYDEERKINHIACIAQDYTHIKNTQAQIQQIAYYDHLTNLPNEYCFHQMLSEKILNANQGDTFALIFIDIDNFQDINNIYGFKMGNLALKSIAIRLDLFFNKDSLLSCINGNHFIAVIDNVSERELTDHLNELQKVFSRELPLNYAHNTPLQINTGVSFFPRDGHISDSLINKANLAVNNVKINHNGHYAIFDSKMMQVSEKILNIKNLIVQGLTHNDYFTLMYQPKVILESGNISGYEVFLRLYSPQMRQEIAPDIFIPIAEKLGLITQLNEWVIREVSIKGAKFYAQEKLKGKISINVCSSQLEDTDFIDSLVDIFRFSELPIQNISFDVKDDISICEQKTVTKNIQRLDKMGIDICIDSFGAKYSYFTTMTELPIKKIKISKNFISNLDRNIKSLAMTKALCTLAHTLKLDIIAVGVENINQEDILKELGCTEAQGFYYSPPQPFDTL